MPAHQLAEKELKLVEEEVILFKRLIHLFKIKKKYLALYRESHFDFLVKHLVYLVEQQQKILQEELVDFQAIVINYQKIISYDETFADSLLDVNIKTRLAKLKTDLAAFQLILDNLKSNLMQQQNVLEYEPVKNFPIYQARLVDEEVILKKSLGFLQEERVEVQELPLYESQETSQGIYQQLWNLFFKSTCVIGSNAVFISPDAGFKLRKYTHMDIASAQKYFNTFLVQATKFTARVPFFIIFDHFQFDHQIILLFIRGGVDRQGQTATTAVMIVSPRTFYERAVRLILEKHLNLFLSAVARYFFGSTLVSGFLALDGLRGTPRFGHLPKA